MKRTLNLINEAAFNFTIGHFVGITKALTIHREFTTVHWRDVVGAMLRALFVISLFVTLPTWANVTILAGLGISLATKVFGVVVGRLLDTECTHPAAY